MSTTSTAHADVWQRVQLVGDTNLTSGSLSNGSGDALASGSVGLYAETSDAGAQLDLTVAFSFGTEGSSVSTPTENEYVGYLQTPTSALGGYIRARGMLAEHKTTRFGASVILRANTTTLDGMGISQRLAVVSVDPAISFSVLMDKTRRISMAADAGVSLRFWNKPHVEFTDAIEAARGHIFFGPRVAAALHFGDVHVGIELTRFFGGDLDGYKEFTILPYVGLAGGLELKEPKPATPDPAPSPAIM